MQWSQWVTLVTGSLATCLNLALMPVILCFSSYKIGSYKYFLLFYTITATIQSFSQVNTLAAFGAPNNGFIFYSTVTFYPIIIQTILLYGIVIGFNCNLLVIAICYYIRLSSLSSIETFSLKVGQLLRQRKTQIGGTIATLLCLFNPAGTFLLNRTDEKTLRFGPEIFQKSGVLLEEVGYVASTIFDDGIPNWRVFFVLGVSSCYMSLVAVYVIYCWWKIHSRLRELRKLKVNCLNLQVQHRLYILLSFQALLPLTFNSAPCVVTFLSSLFGINLGFLITICGSILSTAQIVDPILTVFLISDYRKGILEFFACKRSTTTVNRISSHGTLTERQQ